jgi:hypothetical protein
LQAGGRRFDPGWLHREDGGACSNFRRFPVQRREMGIHAASDGRHFVGGRWEYQHLAIAWRDSEEDRLAGAGGSSVMAWLAAASVQVDGDEAQQAPHERASRGPHVETAPESSLAQSALEFATRHHAGQRRGSDDALFIEHPLEVARLLRDAGCSAVVVAAGLLHDLVEDTRVTIAEIYERFGTDVAALVRSVTEDPSVRTYRRRKLALREQVRDAGGEAALLFAADKIAKVRELPDQARRDRARFGSMPRGQRACARRRRYQQLRMEHYRESLGMLEQVAPRHPLVQRLAEEIERCPVATRRGLRSGDA